MISRKSAENTTKIIHEASLIYYFFTRTLNAENFPNPQKQALKVARM
jgi:hypothetical protein